MSSLDLGIIGNCSISALIDRRARIVWSCLPRFDGDPVFCNLLQPVADTDGGVFEIELLEFERSEQFYLRNSAILVTRLFDERGGAIEITDFAPRFKQFERIFRPIMLVRQVRPIGGQPRIRVRLRPRRDYGAQAAGTTRGSNHVRYVLGDTVMRLTTDVPVSFVLSETPFLLEGPHTLILGPDESFQGSPAATAREFLEKTDDFWRDWVRALNLPFEWQDEVIRAAIALKLCNYEETGAIVAAVTTSVPESADSGRNWDYRFCWLRDSFFVVDALNSLNVTRTLEGYLNYISNLAAGTADGYLQPLFGIGLERQIEESVVEGLAGYRGMGPVRIGNAAYTQVQNDGYGSVILAIAPIFFDQRMRRVGDRALFERLEILGEQARQRWDKPDAGLWELRTREVVHTYSAVLSWAACDRLAKIAQKLGLADRREYWRGHANEIAWGIRERAWNPTLESYVSTFDGEEADASMLLLPRLGFLSANDPRYLGTLKLAEERLLHGRHLYRYVNPDDFGVPETAFNVCTFWYIEALAAVGRTEEAREFFEEMLRVRNSFGLLSEDICPETDELWGNFPQTYSMVGLIHAAKRLSKGWEEAL